MRICTTIEERKAYASIDRNRIFINDILADCNSKNIRIECKREYMIYSLQQLFKHKNIKISGEVIERLVDEYLCEDNNQCLTCEN